MNDTNPVMDDARSAALAALVGRCADAFMVPVSAVLAPSPSRNGGRGSSHAVATRARQAACYLAHRHLHMTQVELAAFFRRDHTSISHGIARIDRLMRSDEEVRLQVFEAAGARDDRTVTSVLDEARRELEAAREVVRRLEHLTTRLEREQGRPVRRVA